LDSNLVIFALDGAGDGLLDAGVHVAAGLLGASDQEVDQLVKKFQFSNGFINSYLKLGKLTNLYIPMS
jgi:hypothetical protein